ncbi:hypothetical protein BSF42_01800 [Flavobacterium sp. ACN6]|nr:hypothetical protein BSF42_01800 [Flavobacterium sp. ACN6]
MKKITFLVFLFSVIICAVGQTNEKLKSSSVKENLAEYR